MTSQNKITSLVEVCLSTGLGFLVSFIAWPFVAALFGYPYSVAHNLAITAIFTALSIIRGYVVRRFFARGMHNAAVRIARRILGNR